MPGRVYRKQGTFQEGITYLNLSGREVCFPNPEGLSIIAQNWDPMEDEFGPKVVCHNHGLKDSWWTVIRPSGTKAFFFGNQIHGPEVCSLPEPREDYVYLFEAEEICNVLENWGEDRLLTSIIDRPDVIII